MKTMVGMDLGEGKSGAGWEKASARYGFSVCDGVGKSRTYADCASGLCKGKGGGGASPRRATPPPCHKCIAGARGRRDGE